jgi:peptidoglycan/LPS O-acetylase OafA/YrhL
MSSRTGFFQALREFLYGMSAYEFEQHALEMRRSMESLFLLVLFGDMVGVPVLPPYYGLRLLPHVVPLVATWKRHLLRERDLADEHEHHLHGV